MHAEPFGLTPAFAKKLRRGRQGRRDYLVKRVFPDLHDWCERRRLRLVDVDLRWGVTEADATENRNVLPFGIAQGRRTCLKRIDEYGPFFRYLATSGQTITVVAG